MIDFFHVESFEAIDLLSGVLAVVFGTFTHLLLNLFIPNTTKIVEKRFDKEAIERAKIQGVKYAVRHMDIISSQIKNSKNVDQAIRLILKSKNLL